jgi:hypothetical protein
MLSLRPVVKVSKQIHPLNLGPVLFLLLYKLLPPKPKALLLSERKNMTKQKLRFHPPQKQKKKIVNINISSGKLKEKEPKPFYPTLPNSSCNNFGQTLKMEKITWRISIPNQLMSVSVLHSSSTTGVSKVNSAMMPLLVIRPGVPSRMLFGLTPSLTLRKMSPDTM